MGDLFEKVLAVGVIGNSLNDSATRSEIEKLNKKYDQDKYEKEQQEYKDERNQREERDRQEWEDRQREIEEDQRRWRAQCLEDKVDEIKSQLNDIQKAINYLLGTIFTIDKRVEDTRVVVKKYIPKLLIEHYMSLAKKMGIFDKKCVNPIKFKAKENMDDFWEEARSTSEIPEKDRTKADNDRDLKCIREGLKGLVEKDSQMEWICREIFFKDLVPSSNMFDFFEIKEKLKKEYEDEKERRIEKIRIEAEAKEKARIEAENKAKEEEIKKEKEIQEKEDQMEQEMKEEFEELLQPETLEIAEIVLQERIEKIFAPKIKLKEAQQNVPKLSRIGKFFDKLKNEFTKGNFW